MGINIMDVPYKKWKHKHCTELPWTVLMAAWTGCRDEIQNIFSAHIYPDYLDDKWYVALLFKNENGEVMLIDPVDEFPSANFKAKIMLLTR